MGGLVDQSEALLWNVEQRILKQLTSDDLADGLSNVSCYAELLAMVQELKAINTSQRDIVDGKSRP